MCNQHAAPADLELGPAVKETLGLLCRTVAAHGTGRCGAGLLPECGGSGLGAGRCGSSTSRAAPVASRGEASGRSAFSRGDDGGTAGAVEVEMSTRAALSGRRGVIGRRGVMGRRGTGLFVTCMCDVRHVRLIRNTKGEPKRQHPSEITNRAAHDWERFDPELSRLELRPAHCRQAPIQIKTQKPKVTERNI